MNQEQKNKILKKLLDKDLIDEKDLSTSNKSLIDEIKEEMHNEYSKNRNKIHDLELENILLDYNITTNL